MAPPEPINELQNPVRLLQVPLHKTGRIHGEVINEDVEISAVAGVVSGGEGVEAPAEGSKPVKSEELDSEGEVRDGIGARVRKRVELSGG